MPRCRPSYPCRRGLWAFRRGPCRPPAPPPVPFLFHRNLRIGHFPFSPSRAPPCRRVAELAAVVPEHARWIEGQHPLRRLPFSPSTGLIEPGGPVPSCASSTSSTFAAAHRSRFGRRRTTPLRIDHTNELTGEARVFLLLSPPLFPSPAAVLVAAGRRCHRVHSGLGVGLNRPAGRFLPLGARPSARIGPATRPEVSGAAPA